MLLKLKQYEIYHFLPLYYIFEENGIYSEFVAEKPRKKDAWFDYDEAIRILNETGVRYSKRCNKNAVAALTTQRRDILNKYSNNTKRIWECYGDAFCVHSFYEKDSFDYMLIPGLMRYEYLKKANNISKLLRVGSPKYEYYRRNRDLEDCILEDRIRQTNCLNKPILLYMPTWGYGSSIQEYASEIGKLRKEYFVISKSHHCTWRLKEERLNLQLLKENSDLLLEGNDNIYTVIMASKMAICDAYSYCVSEIPLVNRQIKLAAILKQDNVEYDERLYDLAKIIRKPYEVHLIVNQMCNEKIDIDKRNGIIEYVYSADERWENQLVEYVKSISGV